MWIFGGHKFLSSPFQKRAVTHCTDMLGIRLLPESEVPVAGSTLSQDLSSLLSAVDLADVIIECKDGSIFAHKAVLGMRCPYFLRCFVTNTVRSTLTETGVDMTVFGMSRL
jgi:BTB/POZ domain